MKFLINLSLIAVLLSFGLNCANAQSPANAEPPTVIEYSPKHLKAAEDFLIATGINTQFATIIDNIINQYSSRVEADKREIFISVMKKFMGKYYSWEAMKGTLAAIYAAEFSESELKQLKDFYNTPAGKKFGAKQAVLTQKGMLAGQQVVQTHQAELQQMIQEAVK